MTEKDPSLIPVQYVKGVGDFRAKILNQIGIITVNDLFEYFPKQYINRSVVQYISEMKINHFASLAGEIVNIRERQAQSGNKQLIVTITDGIQFLECLWFVYGKWISKDLAISSKIWVSGLVSEFMGNPQMVHPQFEILADIDQQHDFWKSRNILPVYKLTGNFSQSMFRNIIFHAFESYHQGIQETLSNDILNEFSFPPRKQALQKVHFTLTPDKIEEIKNRFIFEEFFYNQMMILRSRNKRELITKTRSISLKKTLTDILISSLPYSLTGAQKRVVSEIFKDMSSEKQMNRLLQGDVGSGKTIVSLFAMLLAKENGYQSAFLAPTEILAEQHFRNIQKMLEFDQYPIKVGLLTGGVSKAKKLLKQQIENGEIDIVVGTHALIQKDVVFKNLGFVAVDEQHRFGVKQRSELSVRNQKPDLLYLSATPIPRSLALTLYGELDVSVLDELPPTRKPITTKWVYQTKRNHVYLEIENELKNGRQIYIVCPLIEESEKLDLMAAETLFKDIQFKYFPNYVASLLHGKMKNSMKDDIMQKFLNKDIQILVSTTVIEVGIDVANASVMMIEHAERFGLAQLHQLRGRVGRGAEKSFCYLMAYPPLGDVAKERLRTMEKTNNGFLIAEKDLELRGPGEFFGTNQTGMPSFKFANFVTHQIWLNKAREYVLHILDSDPNLKNENNQLIRLVYQKFYAHRENWIEY